MKIKRDTIILNGGSLQLLSVSDKSCKNEIFEEKTEEKPVYEPEHQSAPEMLKKEIMKETAKPEPQQRINSIIPHGF